MAYKFQVGKARMSGSLVQEGDLTLSGSMTFKSGESLIIGNASLTEAELEQIDGITAGTVAASKAVVVDSNKDITGLRNVTATGYFEIGSAQLTESEMEMLDGITAGTAAASKAVVLDASKDVTGINDLTVAGEFILPQGNHLYLTGDGGSAKIASNGGNAVNIMGAKVVTNGSSIEPDSDAGTDLGSSDKQFADLYLSSELIMGNAVITEAELEQIDGITAGTVAASKAVVVDSNKDITGLRNVTATGYFEIGSAQLTESEMEMLDGITAGTAAASKAVVLDANKDVSGLRDISGRNGSFSALTSGRIVTAGSSGILEDQATLVFEDNRTMDGYLTLTVSSSASGSANLQDGSIQVLDEGENPMLWIYKDTAMIPAAGDAAMVVADSLYFFDATDNTMKREAVGDFSTLIAGDGLGVASSQLKLDLNELTAASINVANDSIVLIDADDSNKSKKESVADVATAMAGAGIGAASGQFKLALDELSDAAVASGDKFAFVDATDDSSKLESIDDMASFFAGAGLAAASGVLKLDVNELSQAAVADGDFIVIEDATDNSTKKEAVADLASLFAGAGLAAASSVIAVANATNGGIGVQANDIKVDLNDLAAGAVDVSADSIAIVDANDSSKSKKESIADLVTAMAGGGLTATNGVLSTQGGVVAAIADGGTLAEGYNYLADLTANATVTLPASPSVGDVVHVKAAALGNDSNVIINRAGSQVIDDDLQSIRIESAFGAVSLVYVVADEWRLV